MSKKKIHKSVLIAAIAGLVVIEVVAMIQGINGKLFGLIAALIGAIGGISLKDVFKVK